MESNSSSAQPSDFVQEDPFAVAIAGASGRMGRMLIEILTLSKDLVLSGAIDVASSPAIGNDATGFLGRASGVIVNADLHRGLSGAQVLIDFTRPEGTMSHLECCVQKGIKMVIGTTGFTPAQTQAIKNASQKIAIVMSPNMSVGVNVMLKLLEVAAHSLPSEYDIEIIEAHHRHKVDAPSGTALKMGQVIAAAKEAEFDKVSVFTREGHTGPRKPATIGFATVRGGDIVGDHTALFAGEGERIEITHRSSSRANYAQGSLQAAKFLRSKENGLFDMFDVLGLRD
jgi:4-hydroxy-tetrahydrodipicolinate reductase